MTYKQFEDELYIIRDNWKTIRSAIKSLKNLEEDGLVAAYSGAIDYSKERLQSSTDPDAKMIAVIQKCEDEKTKIMERIANLREENRMIEELIYQEKNIGGETLRLYFIDNKPMREVAKYINYSQSQTWEIWKKAKHGLYERYEEIYRHD